MMFSRPQIHFMCDLFTNLQEKRKTQIRVEDIKKMQPLINQLRTYESRMVKEGYWGTP